MKWPLKKLQYLLMQVESFYYTRVGNNVHIVLCNKDVSIFLVTGFADDVITLKSSFYVCCKIIKNDLPFWQLGYGCLLLYFALFI